MQRHTTQIRLMTLILMGLSSLAGARTYYVNRGIKYHIGDNRFETSEDKQFLDAYPVVGQEWIQAFKVSAVDKVKIHIEHIWGVDDCSYCKTLVAIDKHDMGRLTAENNHTPFDTLQPLAMDVEPGKIYYIRITSYGTDKVDDLVVEGVSVESDKAEVLFLQPGPVLQAPGLPMPQVHDAPVSGSNPCANLDAGERWLAARPGAGLEIQSADDNLKSSEPLAEIQPGQVLSFSLYVKTREAGKDLVSQELAVIVDDGQASGWVFSFGPGETVAGHGNLLLSGRYTGKNFDPGHLASGAWAQAKLGWCRDGSLHLSIDGREISQSFKREGSLLPLRLRVLNLGAKLEPAK